MRKLLLLASLLCLTAAMPATRINAPLGGLDLYIDANAGNDVDGCGSASGSAACASIPFFWTQFARDYDLRCQQARIHLAYPAVYTAGLIARGSPMGVCTQMQRDGNTPVSLADTKQVMFIGDLTGFSAVVRPTAPTNGPMFFAENGAIFSVEGVTFDGVNGPVNSDVPIVVGATANSAIGLGANIFGCSPGLVEIEVGVQGKVFVFASYTINHWVCGASNTAVGGSGAVVSGTTNIGLSSPTSVAVGMYVQARDCVPDGTTITAITGLNLTTSAPSTCSDGLEPIQFSTAHMGVTVQHISLDQYAYADFESCNAPVPCLTVSILNTPSYGLFVYVDDSVLMLNPLLVSGDAVVWQGSIIGTVYSLVQKPVIGGSGYTNPGYIFNSPNNQAVVLTP